MKRALLDHRVQAALLAVAALAMGASGLHRPLWTDELMTGMVSGSWRPLGDYFTPCVTRQFQYQPPFYFLLVHLVTSVLGDRESSLRLVSLVATAGSVTVIYLLGRRFWGSRAGLVAGLLALFSPLRLQVGGWARPYALAELLALSALLALSLARGKRRLWALATCGLLLVLAGYSTNGNGPLAIVGIALVLVVWRGPDRTRSGRISGLVVTGVALLAVLPAQLAIADTSFAVRQVLPASGSEALSRLGLVLTVDVPLRIAATLHQVAHPDASLENGWRCGLGMVHLLLPVLALAGAVKGVRRREWGSAALFLLVLVHVVGSSILLGWAGVPYHHGRFANAGVAALLMLAARGALVFGGAAGSLARRGWTAIRAVRRAKPSPRPKAPLADLVVAGRRAGSKAPIAVGRSVAAAAVVTALGSAAIFTLPPPQSDRGGAVRVALAEVGPKTALVISEDLAWYLVPKVLPPPRQPTLGTVQTLSRRFPLQLSKLAPRAATAKLRWLGKAPASDLNRELGPLSELAVQFLRYSARAAIEGNTPICPICADHVTGVTGRKQTVNRFKAFCRDAYWFARGRVAGRTFPVVLFCRPVVTSPPLFSRELNSIVSLLRKRDMKGMVVVAENPLNFPLKHARCRHLSGDRWDHRARGVKIRQTLRSLGCAFIREAGGRPGSGGGRDPAAGGARPGQAPGPGGPRLVAPPPGRPGVGQPR